MNKILIALAAATLAVAGCDKEGKNAQKNGAADSFPTGGNDTVGRDTTGNTPRTDMGETMPAPDNTMTTAGDMTTTGMM